MQVEVVVLGSLSLIVLVVSMDVKQHQKKKRPVWPSGKAVRLVSRRTTVRISYGFPFSLKVVVYGHCDLLPPPPAPLTTD